MWFRCSAVFPLAVYGLLSVVGGSRLHAQHQSDSVLADFNNDKRVDLAIPNFANVILRLGNGDGTFQRAITIPVAPISEFCTAIASADFNRDGNMDLAVVCGASNVSQLFVLNGNGDGTFAPPTSYPTPNSGVLVVGDLNNDGYPDVVETGAGDGPKVHVFLNQRDGTFKISYFTFPASFLPGAALGDWNGDGILDLALARGNGDVRIYLGKGDGTFRFLQEYVIAGPSDQRMFLAVADLNGDGKSDLLIGEGNFNPERDPVNLYAFLFGNGDGAFQAAQVFPGPKFGNAFGVVAADFNGDGITDSAISNWHNSHVSVFLGKGGGTFQPPAEYGLTFGSDSNLLLADLNGDGNLDIYVPNALISMINNGDGTFKLVKAYTP